MALTFTYGPSTTDSLLTSTLSYWVENDMIGQIFDDTPFLAELLKKSKKADGGATLLVPLMYAVNGTTTWYSGYDQLDTTPLELAA